MNEHLYRTTCLTRDEIRGLRGGRKRGEYVYVGDAPDARCCSELKRVRVDHNWPSQRHDIYPNGYIEFSDGRPFCLQRQSVFGKPKFLFRKSRWVIGIANRLGALSRLENGLKRLTKHDLSVVLDLVNEFRNLPSEGLAWLPDDELRERIMIGAWSIGVTSIRDLIDLIEGIELAHSSRTSDLPARVVQRSVVPVSSHKHGVARTDIG